ncbi:ATPase family AAA domain-containing protein [Cucumis melo var. makuwa]|uniref:ATPase family AAA domain-containing protein n=1 Tax=Cucumis melo var. makuwa TaxID=1194695 RepID=A0A5D3BUQ9_CUCMM|nr:ATPase family AAA domain-containing protein [Cucumis melo var. makuwa]
MEKISVFLELRSSFFLPQPSSSSSSHLTWDIPSFGGFIRRKRSKKQLRFVLLTCNATAAYQCLLLENVPYTGALLVAVEYFNSGIKSKKLPLIGVRGVGQDVDIMFNVVFRSTHGEFYQSNLALTSTMYPKQTGLGDGPVSSPLRTSARPRKRPISYGRPYVYYGSSATFKPSKNRTPAVRIAKLLRPKKQSMPTANAVGPDGRRKPQERPSKPIDVEASSSPQTIDQCLTGVENPSLSNTIVGIQQAIELLMVEDGKISTNKNKGSEIEYNHQEFQERLLRKMPLLVGPFCCILCRKAEEDLDHILWHCGEDRQHLFFCSYAAVVWNKLLKLFYFSLVFLSYNDLDVIVPGLGLGYFCLTFGALCQFGGLNDKREGVQILAVTQIPKMKT